MAKSLRLSDLQRGPDGSRVCRRCGCRHIDGGRCRHCGAPVVRGEKRGAPEEEGVGIACPGCGGMRTVPIRKRAMPGRVIRRRECLSCGRRWNTVEMTREDEG